MTKHVHAIKHVCTILIQIQFTLASKPKLIERYIRQRNKTSYFSLIYIFKLICKMNNEEEEEEEHITSNLKSVLF